MEDNTRAEDEGEDNSDEEGNDGDEIVQSGDDDEEIIGAEEDLVEENDRDNNDQDEDDGRDKAALIPGVSEQEQELDDDAISFVDCPSDWDHEVDEDGNTIVQDISDLVKYIPMGAVPATNFTSNPNDKSVDPNPAVKSAAFENQNHYKSGRILTFPNWVQVMGPLLSRSCVQCLLTLL
jgi:hypothetical protein